MTTYTIFGTGTPAGVSASGDTAEISVSTAFYVLGVTGWRAAGVRIWIPAGISITSTGKKAYLWIGTTNTPDSMLATVDFTDFVAGAWNTALFSSPVSLIAGRYYWAQVYLPAGGYGFQAFKFGGSALGSVDSPSLWASASSETVPGNGSFITGAAGQAPNASFNSSWYGVDVLVDDGVSSGGPGADDTIGIADTVTAVRSGLPSAVNASGSATDPIGASASDTSTFPIGGATAFHTVRRSLFETRISWGAVTNKDVKGPEFVVEAPLTLGLEFKVLWPVRFIGCRIYKAPNATGSIPVRLWDKQGTGGAARELGLTTVSWVADAGGWREITFSAPIDLDVDVTYTLSYFAASGHFSLSQFVFFWWSDVVAPLVVKPFADSTQEGGSAYRADTLQQIPERNSPHNYYIEPIVEWDSTDPVFVPDPERSYYDQWVNGKSAHKFLIGVFYADPPFLQEYMDMGVNALVAGPGTPDYVTAVKAAGIDHYPFINPSDDPLNIGLSAVMEDPAYAALVRGYVVSDEPDMFFPYTPPSTMRTWCNATRLIDSTRPLKIGLGNVTGMNQSFHHQPQGSNMDVANELWRGWAALPDLLSGDYYTLSPTEDPADRLGVWMYPVFVRRLRTFNEGRTPIIITVETTSQSLNYPVPDDVRKAIWACLIEGIGGIILFDHRFGSNVVSQDFAHMLHNPPMKTMMTALIVRINSLVDAINSPNTNLVTAVTSSNTTSGPRGGTWGVPMHYCTRADEDYEYLWAMGIRPGSTTATFTIPSWAGEILEVIDEDRTVTVDGNGILTDTFAADYSVHLYRKG